MSDESDLSDIEKIRDLAEIENLIGYHSLQEQNAIRLRLFGMAQHHRTMQDILFKLKDHVLKKQSEEQTK